MVIFHPPQTEGSCSAYIMGLSISFTINFPLLSSSHREDPDTVRIGVWEVPQTSLRKTELLGVELIFMEENNIFSTCAAVKFAKKVGQVGKNLYL